MVQELSEYREEIRSLLTHVDTVNQEEEEETSRSTECSCPSNQTISVHILVCNGIHAHVKMCSHGVVYLEILQGSTKLSR
jgi:hypothetical protein